MKKIILSVAVAAMALATTASALEDIKVNGQTKLWYETSDKGDASLFNKDGASGETVLKLGVTGKQGDIGFGTTIYQVSTMGLEGFLVSGTRTYAGSGYMFTGEAYVTAPMGSDTTLKFGQQELNTPFLFTEKWNALPVTYNAAVAVNKSIENLTIIGAYVGQTSANEYKDANADGKADAMWKSAGTPVNQINSEGAFALGGLYKADGLGVNAWYYSLPNVASAFWADASMNVADGVNVKAYLASMMPTADGVDPTTGYAVSASAKVSGISLFAAMSMVGENTTTGAMGLNNVGTSGKKTKLPTAGVYTDGVYVAQPSSTAVKLKAVTKVGSTKLIAQVISNTNDKVETKETTEIDIIAIQKVGDFNIKGILMNRSFTQSAEETKSGAMHVRLIVSLNF